MTAGQQFLIGIDTGGTFTDVVVMSQSGELWHAKASTTPDDFSRGVMDALSEAASELGLSRSDLLTQTILFKHGSTVATNALITRNGIKVGFLTTKGFEDTTEIMRGWGRVDGLSEEEIRHVMWVTKPQPIVPRECIIGVSERIDYRGEVVVPLNRDETLTAIRRLIDEDQVGGIAVSLLHAWANPTHEEEIHRLARDADPDERVYWSFGSQLAQTAGEYARANTAILNCYLGPTVEQYLRNLEANLRHEGLKEPLLIMQGNGGVAHREQVTPIANFQSGPAGGMIASHYVAGLLAHQNVITTDMGGTSFDVGLITEGYWRYAQEPVLERFRTLQPIIDIESIGAGGGTIARVDPETARLLVGPNSAGASPGPVCYDQGGEQITVTDCDLILGVLDPDYFLGGRQRLNADKAQRLLEEKIARPLGMDARDAAAGVFDIVNAKMADLIRRQVIRTGYLPEEFVIYAFGGAGAVHAAGFASELGVKRIYIFPTSPVFSAFGVAAADVLHTRVVSCQYLLPVEPELLNLRLESIEKELLVNLAGEEFQPENIEFRRFFTMRYRRQTAGVEIPLSRDRFTTAHLSELAGVFEEKYEELYGVGAGFSAAGIEIGAIRVDALGLVAKPPLQAQPGAATDAAKAVKGNRQIYFTQPQRQLIDTPVYDYARLGAGCVVDGPGVIELPFTTVLAPPACRVSIDEYLNLIMDID